MGDTRRKPEIVTFKADPDLVDAMRGIPNRSEFIREAILAALADVCPVCRGQGTLTAVQRRHWEEFSKEHTVESCDKCRNPRLVCHAQEHRIEDPPSARTCAPETEE
ncbi:MAG: CopG family transcriptional regulator [Acidobacteria bacterium]|nr:CopG family transcriptional regulator [Acidobacteriota bacterium]